MDRAERAMDDDNGNDGDNGIPPDYEPEIIAFVCASSGSWNSPQIMDLRRGRTGGEEANFRMEIYPLDCAGALPSVLITDTLEKGADGILVITCGQGLCHYFDGDERMDRRFDTILALAEDLALESDRIRFRKVGDRGRETFDEVLEELLEDLFEWGANPMKRGDRPTMERGIRIWPDPEEAGCAFGVRDGPDDVAGTGDIGNGEGRTGDIGNGEARAPVMSRARETGVLQCLECGKCTASCPVTLVKDDFSPMYLIEKALRAPEEEVGTTPDYWTCLTCANCVERCPSAVDFVDFVRFLREREDISGGICTHGGVLQSIWRHQAGGDAHRQQQRTSWVTDDLDISGDGDVLYWVGCMPYFDVLFDDIGFNGGAEIARNAVRVLNAAGIAPVILEDEVCCGHDAYFTGDTDLFGALARKNAGAIADSGVSTVVCTCPEGVHMLRSVYPGVTDLDVEVLHMSEMIVRLMEEGRLEVPGPGEDGETGAVDHDRGRRVTYHDPCRMVRFERVPEAPRRVLSGIPGLELVEMERSRELSTCCGTSAWMNCDAVAEGIRSDRLRECRAAGARTVVTACPKCQIHFRCTLSAKPEMRDLDPGLEIVDLTTLVARALPGPEPIGKDTGETGGDGR